MTCAAEPRRGGAGGGRITANSQSVARGLVMPNKEQRARLFRRMDYNGNGVLSLAEIDKAIIELWPQLNHKQVLMMAYHAADVSGDGFIGRREFRLLVKYLVYFTNKISTRSLFFIFCVCSMAMNHFSLFLYISCTSKKN